MENITDEQFHHLLSNFDSCPPGFESFSPFIDPSLFPVPDVDLHFFPPLPPIQEEEITEILEVPPLDYDDESIRSIATSVPEIERDEALELVRWTQSKLDQQIAKHEQMQLE